MSPLPRKRDKYVPHWLKPAEMARFGFEWAAESGPDGQAPRVQVTRVSQIKRRRGLWRILSVITAKQQVYLYITPTGMIRVFDGVGGEYKLQPKEAKHGS